MRRARIDGLRPARGEAIALTITRCTKVRAALGHAPRNMAFGGTRIDTALGPRVRHLVTTAAFSTAARRIEFAHIIPVVGPFPDIANHVIKTEPIGQIASHRSSAFKPGGRKIFMWELALPGLGLRHRSEEHTSELQSPMHI